MELKDGAGSNGTRNLKQERSCRASSRSTLEAWSLGPRRESKSPAVAFGTGEEERERGKEDDLRLGEENE